MSRLEATIENSTETELGIIGSLGQYWLNGEPKKPIPTYQGLIFGLRFILNEFKESSWHSRAASVPYDIFDQTSLRLFEFLDAISYAMEHGHLDEELVKNHTLFWKDLEMFEKYRNSVLRHHPNAHYQEHIRFIR